MTNMIQFNSSIASTTSRNLLVSNNGSSISNSCFNELFSTLLSDMNSISSPMDSNESSNGLMTPVLAMMFSKLFGNDLQPLLTANEVPQGAPVHGVLTQTSHEGHVALDYGIPVGTNVKSTLDGKVTYAGWNNEGYGNLVIVDNGTYKTYYAHLSSIPVTVGQKVSEGEVIGLSGNTGNSTGPHLHYEIRKNGVAINPLTFVRD